MMVMIIINIIIMQSYPGSGGRAPATQERSYLSVVLPNTAELGNKDNKMVQKIIIFIIIK